MTSYGNVTIRGPRAGDEYWLVGDLYTLKATGEDTGGSYSLVEILVSPGKGPRCIPTALKMKPSTSSWEKWNSRWVTAP